MRLSIFLRALALKFGSEFVDLPLKLKSEGRLHRVIEIIVERICKVLVLSPQQIKLPKLSELKSLFESGQLPDIL